jgi:hypothetical protein
MGSQTKDQKELTVLVTGFGVSSSAINPTQRQTPEAEAEAEAEPD